MRTCIVTLLTCYLLLLSFATSQTFNIDTVVGHRFYDGDGFVSLVSVNTPYSIAFHPITEDLFIVDSGNHVIRKIDKVSGVITTVAGTPSVQGYSGDSGLATGARLSSPMNIAFSPDGQTMYIADYKNHRVRMVKDGIITTVAGNGADGFGGDGVPATNTSLNWPYDMTILPTTGELVIADRSNHRIRKVDLNGIISTIAGTGTRTGDGGALLGDDGPAINATLKAPEKIITNSIGEIFIADQGNN